MDRTAQQALPGDFFLDRWQVQPSVNRISGEGQTHQVEPKVMAVLLELVARQGEVVTRNELMQTVWAGTYVVEETLTRCISELRKVLGDESRHPHIIETIRKTGYRLMVPVTFAVGDEIPSSRPSIPVEQLHTKDAPNVSKRLHLWILGAAVLLGLVAVVGWGLMRWREPAQVSIVRPWQPVPLTNYPGIEHDPALSPDGAYLAFAWQGPGGNDTDIYVKLIGTETALPLTDDPATERSPAWAPDGHHIAFLRYRDGGSCSIVVVPIIGGTPRQAGSCDGNFKADLAWSPEGRWLAYSKSTEAGALGIFLFDTETKETRRLTRPALERYGDHDPSFSPDGRWVAFTRKLNEEMEDIYLIPVEGGNATRLTFDDRLVAGHSWTPGGEALTFASNRAGLNSLWRVPRLGGTPTWMGLGGDGMAYPTMARRGTGLAYQHKTWEVGIWRLPLDPPYGAGSRPERLLPSTRIDGTPSYSPDGYYMAFASNRTGHFEIWRADRDGTNPLPLTDFNGPLVETPRWSPDGQHLAFNARPDGAVDLHVLDLETGAVRRLTDTPSDDWMPSWSPDGRWIFFGSDRGGTWQVWKMPAEGGIASPMTTEGGWAPQASLDGTWVYYARRGTSGLWRIPVEGGRAEEVFRDLHAVDWGNWAVVEEGVFAVQRTNQGAQLVFVETDTGRTDRVAAFPHPLTSRIPSLALSPDHTDVLFTSMGSLEGDIMLVDLSRP